jgi:hypothetical protein
MRRSKHHAIIYSSKDLPKELEGEGKLSKAPIRVKIDNLYDKLDPESRVNYSKLYTVEHNIKVQFIGEVYENSKHTFFRDFERTFSKD